MKLTKQEQIALGVVGGATLLVFLGSRRGRQTAPSVRVTSRRIEIGQIIEFDYDSDRIRPSSFSTLNAVARAIIDRGLAVEIVGHTDDVGSAAYNMDLSERRANSVMDYLLDAGVPVGRLLAYGMGEEEPVAPNTTAANRQRNRRVEFRIVPRIVG